MNDLEERFEELRQFSVISEKAEALIFLILVY